MKIPSITEKCQVIDADCNYQDLLTRVKEAVGNKIVLIKIRGSKKRNSQNLLHRLRFNQAHNQANH